MSFFNQSAIKTTPRSSRRHTLKKRLDTADIVRDVRKVGHLVQVAFGFGPVGQMSEKPVNRPLAEEVDSSMSDLA
jgi:hypothetical protein